MKMKTTQLSAILGCLEAAALLFSGSLRAETGPLTLYQVDTFAQYMGCLKSGTDTDECPSANATWEKDLQGSIDEADFELAIREYWDDGELTYICYKNRVGDDFSQERSPQDCDGDCAVIPHSLCDPGAAECLKTRTPDECEDVDQDGIRTWQEDLIGSSDYVPNAACNKAETPESCGFTQVCTDNLMYTDPVSGLPVPILGDATAAICAPRKDCKEGECTVFHLETASVNNNELIVYVVFDYAPVAPTIIDLYIDYDFNYLTLIDARLMKIPCAPSGMCEIGKELTVGHPSDNRLRLTVLSPNANTAILSGHPIIELVFDRIANGQTNVGFTNQDHLQTMAFAPDQGVDENNNLNRNELADDSLWGEAVQVPAVDPSGPRLLLYYSFDNQSNYLDYLDVKDGIELCSLIGECSILDETDDYQREQKEIFEAKLNTLQRGSERVSEQIEAGVIGPAAYMDGRTDHLEMPITVNDPVKDSDGHYYYQKKDQSFSLSTWFYTEGDNSLDISEFGQILFSRNKPEEETKFGVALRRIGSDVALVWFDGVLEDFGSTGSNYSENIIVSSVPVRRWTHLGMVFQDTVAGVDDDKDGKTDEADDEFDRVNFYINGQPVELTGFTQRPGIDDNHDGTTDEAGEPVIDMPLVGPSGDPVYSADAFKLGCPYPAPSGGLILHEEGKDVGALGNLGAPEALYFASAKNNQFGIETMDLYGFERKDVLRDGVTSAKEVDYNPTLDKFVYSSNKSGSYEIWIADGDGSNAKQITQGFGDTARGIFARRPRWAPDSSAIIFDSNAYNLENMDNLTHRVYHLYYIQYDRLKNEVAVPLEDGGISTVLDYDFIVANQTVSFYRLTDGTLRNNYEAVWIMGRGKDPTNADIDIKGKIWFNSSSYKHDGKEIRVMTIPSVIAPQAGEIVFGANGDTCLTVGTGADTNDLNIEYSILDGYRIVTAAGATTQEQSQIIFKKEWVTYEDETTYTTSTGAFQYEAINAQQTTVTLNDDDDDTSNDQIADAVTVDIYYVPLQGDYDTASCWDLNFNTICDTDDEDKNGDDSCTWIDCVNSEIPELYVQYDAELVYSLASRALLGSATPVQDDTDRDPLMDIMAPGGLAKDIKVYDQPTIGEEYVKARVGSEVNNLPIYLPNAAAGNGMFLARLTFVLDPDADLSDLPADLLDLFTLKIRKVNQRLGMVDMDESGSVVGPIGRFTVADNALEFVEDATFSPDGNRLVLSGIEKARPVVLVQKKDPTDNLYDEDYINTYNMYDAPDSEFRLYFPAGPDASCGDLMPIEFEKISVEPMNVDGMTWEKLERFYPCNWMGAHKDRDSKLFQNAFRGGMDELHLYSYPRDPRGFLSDYERGAAWLKKEGRDGELPAKTRSCADHYDCPSYMLCMESGSGKTCQLQACDPNETDSCKCPASDPTCDITGVCTLMPVPTGLGEMIEDPDTGEMVPARDEMSWVCAAECSSDTQCFKEECLNGPCRFCGDNNSCSECRWTTREISGTLSIDEIEGCPDRNSWDCVDGSCVTECYAFENGQAIFLCDPALEYCNQGRCKMFDWDWTDLAPSTFSSIGDMAFATIGRSTAISQLYPIEVIAYGIEDYLHPPEILVEGKGRDEEGGYGFDLEWFKVGQIQVYNKDRNEAQENPYVVYSPIPLSDVRLHLIQPLYENPSAAATGLGEWDAKRCRPNFCQTCTRWSNEPSQNPNTGCSNYVCEAWSDDNNSDLGVTNGACNKRAPGSRASIGYPVGIPERSVRKACADRGLPNCHYLATDDFANAYFTGGQAAAVVLEVKVAGMSVPSNGNSICPYTSVRRVIGNGYGIADETISNNTGESIFYQNIPAADGGLVSIPIYKRLVYGPDDMAELSNQRAAYYPIPSSEEAKLAHAALENEAILNCNHFVTGAQVMADYEVCPRSLNECFNTLYPTSGRDGAIFETENGCSIERGMRRTPCYEFTGSEVTLDFMTYTGDSKEVWHTLDFDLHRSFGYDEGSLKQ